MPRIAPPRSKLEPAIRKVEARLGVQSSEDGTIAFKSLDVALQELLQQDAGKYDMPPLPALLGGEIKVPVVVSFDGTGFGSLSLNTAVIRNPYMGAAAQQLRPIGLSRGSDDKKGTEAVFGPNLSRLRELFRIQERANVCE